LQHPSRVFFIAKKRGKNVGITKTKIDWEKLKLEFVTDPQKPTLENFCGTRKIPYSTARKRSGAEQWMADRNTHWNTVTTRAAPVIAEMQAVVLARDEPLEVFRGAAKDHPRGRQEWQKSHRTGLNLLARFGEKCHP
jgi:hypothetical protein